MGYSGKYPARIFRAPGQKQKTLFQGKLIGCTETAFAVGCGDTTNGALKVTEEIVRHLSGEWPPDPKSPGLNQNQLDKVAAKLHIDYTDASGYTWDYLVARCNENRRLVIQLWYADIGGGKIGHAFLMEAIRPIKVKGKTVSSALCMDPITGKRKWYPVTTVRKAMQTFATMTGVSNGGLRFGYFQICKYVAAGAS